MKHAKISDKAFLKIKGKQLRFRKEIESIVQFVFAILSQKINKIK